MSSNNMIMAAAGGGSPAYDIEIFVWGAGGTAGSGGSGGGGGAAYGKLNVKSTLYIMVGDYGCANNNADETRTKIEGGGAFDASNTDGGGGGYSGVFYSSIQQSNALLIAGGGGGGAYGGYGGAGGGTNGQAGQADGGFGAQQGTGATQTAGGYYFADPTAGVGTALLAGYANVFCTGGGGYWGGGGSRYTGAGGGSGYYNPTHITNAVLSTGNLNTPGDSSNSLRGTYGNGGIAPGGLGVKGVVIIRYLGTQRGTGGTVTSSGGYTYHTFTTVGTNVYIP